MKIVLFGASGKTGQVLLKKALQEGHEVVAYVRRSASIAISHPSLTIVEGQLHETQKIQEIMRGVDACISTLGGASLTKRSPQIVDGIQQIIQTMEKERVPRFLYLSSFGASESKKYMPQPIRFLICDCILRVPLSDHNINEKRIFESSLEWTIFRPGGLSNGPETNKIKHGSEAFTLKGNPSISRENVARFMLQQLSDTSYVRKSVWMFE